MMNRLRLLSFLLMGGCCFVMGFTMNTCLAQSDLALKPSPIPAKVSPNDLSFSEKITYKLYKLVYVPDSAQPDDKRNEYMYLFYKDGNSYFQSQSGFKMDAAKERIFLKNPFTAIVVKRGLDTVHTIDRIASFFYYYTEPARIRWQILPDTQRIGTFTCQKATTHFGGRDWTAWFAPDIPISDGPYKFAGLPGLVLQVQDSQQFFTFSFEALTHVSTSIDGNLHKDVKQITKKKFFELRSAYRENPMPFESQNKTFTSGKDLIEQRIKAYINKNNNLIERNLN